MGSTNPEPTTFYSNLLPPAEQRFLASAPLAASLQPEIALLRARVATLLSSNANSPQAARDLAATIALLTRAVAVQSRLRPGDTTLADFNDGMRRFLIAKADGPEPDGDDTEPTEEP
jgi:hypothetical protein